MPTPFRVALLQMAGAGWDQTANLRKGDLFCRQAKDAGADLALFPEMWNIGYTFFDPQRPESKQEWEKQAIEPDNPFVQHFARLAAELEMAIAITYLEKWPGAPRNTATLFDRRGQQRLTYAKVHTCAFDIEAALTPGDHFQVCPLDTSAGDVTIGFMICFDREFPESARLLMLLGAEIILTPNACTLEINRLSQFRTRAFENMTGVAMANYAAPDANGHSVAYDGIAFAQDESSREMCLVEAGETEGVFLAEFDLDALRTYRRNEVWGSAWRRPNVYTSLITASSTGRSAP